MYATPSSLKPGSQYDATLTQHDAGRGVNYAGIGSISNPASRCVALRHIVNRPLVITNSPILKVFASYGCKYGLSGVLAVNHKDTAITQSQTGME